MKKEINFLKDRRLETWRYENGHRKSEANYKEIAKINLKNKEIKDE